jgi:hypothetical protein
MTEIESIQSKAVQWLRFILAATVVLLHTTMKGYVDFVPLVEQPLSATIYRLFSWGLCTLAVPTFFLFSGYYFFTKLQEWDYGIYWDKLKKRAKTLLLPYVLWITIAFILSFTIGIITNWGGQISIIGDFKDCLSEHGWLRIYWDNNRIGENPERILNVIGVPMHHSNPFVSPLWFIRDLMVVMVLSPVVYVFVKYFKIWGLAIVAVLMSLNIWVPLEGFFAPAFFFFVMGAFFQVHSRSFLLGFRKIEIPSYVLTIVFLAASLLAYGHDYYLSEFFRKIFSIFGVISVVNISSYLIEHDRVRVYHTLAASSFFIYATHTICVSRLSSYIMSHVVPYDNTVAYIITYFMQAFLTVAICLGVFVVLKRICPHILSVLTGGR